MIRIPMAIVQLRKLTLIGRDSQRERVLMDLQGMGCMHVIDLPRMGTRQDPSLPLAMELRAALRYLEACPDQRPVAASGKDYDPQVVVQLAMENETVQRGLQDERRELREAIEQLKPWGEFQLPPASELAGQQLWFYRVRHWQADAFRRLSQPTQLVARDIEFEYWLVIAPDEVPGLPVPKVDLGNRPLSELQQSLESIDQRLEQLELERIALTKWIKRLRAELTAADDLALRLEATRRTVRDESLFAIQGWVPVGAVSRLQDYAQQNQLALTVQAPQPGETPPTLLHNAKLIAGAENAVTFYVTPSYRSWDPTWIMYF
jgi:V/A-type H+-transporting ATPase subunit I